MITVSLDSLNGIEEMFTLYPERVKLAAQLAINQTARREALSSIQRDMMQQVNFKLSYLRSRDHMGIGKFATQKDLVATIYARDRPTMLNRFRPNPNHVPKRTGRGKNKGVTVRVKPTVSRHMKGAFVHRFKKSGNIGVMVRTAGGASDPPKGITRGGGRYIQSMRAWLLYAPSIDQVMVGTAIQNRERIQSYLAAEFLRQFNRLQK